MEGNDNVVEEGDVLLPQGHGVTGNDRGLDVEKLPGSVWTISFMNELEEVGIHDVPDHLSTSNDLGVKLVQDVLQEIPFLFVLGFEELDEALHELGVYELLDHTLVDVFACNHPVEELIHVLEVRPGRVSELLLLDTGVLFL